MSPYRSRFLLSAVVLVLTVACSGVSTSYEERGDSYYKSGQYDDSLAEYLMAEKTEGVSAPLLRKIGKAYVMKGDFFQAKKYFDRFFSAHDAEPDSEVLLDYLQIALDRGRSGDTTTMVHALEEILAIQPNYNLGKYYFDLGEYYYQEAEYQKAILYFQRGYPLHVEMDNRAAFLYHLALSYEKLEDFSNAFLYFDQFITLYPESQDIEQARWHRGSCSYPLARQMFESGDNDQAYYYLDVIISSGLPQHLVDDAYFLKGEILLSEDRLEEAKAAYQQVLDMNKYYWKEKVAEQARKRIQEIDFNRKGTG